MRLLNNNKKRNEKKNKKKVSWIDQITRNVDVMLEAICTYYIYLTLYTKKIIHENGSNQKMLIIRRQQPPVGLSFPLLFLFRHFDDWKIPPYEHIHMYFIKCFIFSTRLSEDKAWILLFHDWINLLNLVNEAISFAHHMHRHGEKNQM